jgi:hypothetical protein
MTRNRERMEEGGEKKDLTVCFRFLMDQNLGKSQVMTTESNTQREIKIQAA